jgi:hypothetical protein
LIKNWIEDINLFKVEFDDCGGCKVNAGFWNAYIELRE